MDHMALARFAFRCLTISLASFLAACALAQTSVPVTNPDFEDGFYSLSDRNGQVTGMIGNGWYDNSGYGDYTAVYSQDQTTVHGSTSSQKISVSAIQSGNLQMLQFIPLHGGRVYSLSVWIKGDPGTSVGAVIQGAGPNYPELVSITAPLTGQWQNFTAEGYVQQDSPAGLIIVVNTPGTVYVDDVSVTYITRALNLTPPLGPVKDSFFGMHVAGITEDQFENGGFAGPYYAVGVEGQSQVAGFVANKWIDNSLWADVNVVYSIDTAKWAGGATAQVVDVQAVNSGEVQFMQPLSVLPGQTYTATAWVKGTPGMSLQMLMGNQLPPYNTYASADLSTIGPVWQKFTMTGAVGDQGYTTVMFAAAGSGRFEVGDVTFTLANGQPAAGGSPWPVVPFGALRLWDANTTWAQLEPKKGTWNFATLDSWVQMAAGREIILTLGQCPMWASSSPLITSYYGPGASAPPTNVQDWVDYVTTVAKRYKGKIKTYEIWNEPNDTQYYTGSISELVTLTELARTALKGVDPSIKVASAAPYSPGYLDFYLQAGANRYIDVVDYHSYTTPPEQSLLTLANVKLVMEKDGVGSLPLYDSEAASGSNTTPPNQAATYIARKFLTDLAAGATRLDWYTWGRVNSFCVGTIENDPGVLTPAAKGYATVHSWLQGAWVRGGHIDGQGDWVLSLILANGKPALIVWNPTAPTEFTLPASFYGREVTGLDGATTLLLGFRLTVSDSPVLISS